MGHPCVIVKSHCPISGPHGDAISVLGSVILIQSPLQAGKMSPCTDGQKKNLPELPVFNMLFRRPLRPPKFILSTCKQTLIPETGLFVTASTTSAEIGGTRCTKPRAQSASCSTDRKSTRLN